MEKTYNVNKADLTAFLAMLNHRQNALNVFYNISIHQHGLIPDMVRVTVG